MMFLTVAGCGSDNDSESVYVPEKYDLRDHSLITPVKNQCGLREDGVSDVGTAVGLCWAFASLSSFESSLLKQGYQTDPMADTANLSPWYLGNYITYNAHPLNFNGTIWLSPVELVPATTYGYNESMTAKGWGGGGGGGHWVSDYINGGNSVVLWKDAPMPNEQMTRHENLQKPAPRTSCCYMVKDMYLYEPDDFKTPEAFRYHIKKAVLKYGAVQSYVNLDAVDIVVYRNASFPPAVNSAALYAQTFHIREKGYHMLDFKRLLNFASGDSMTIVIQYRYRQGNEHPIVYVTDSAAQMPPSYWSASGDQTWKSFPADSAFYIQAIMSDE